MSEQTSISFGVDEAFDIIEGIVDGGLIGFGAYIVGSAVSILPSSFIQPQTVTPLAVIVGALGFIGVALKNMRERRLNKTVVKS
jgi:VIT1/CCC1 family predicted Fe2+/Mn2+ transporter